MSVVAIGQCLQVTVIVLCKYIVSFLQHSTEAPLDRQDTLIQQMALHTLSFIIKYYKLTRKTFLKDFYNFYYSNTLKVFNNCIAFKCLCHNYLCTCSGSCT